MSARPLAVARLEAFEDFPGLFEADQRAHQTIGALRLAIAALEGDTPREGGWAARAEQLRGIATEVHAVALELAVCAGWNAAASKAAEPIVIGNSPEIAGELNENRHLPRSATEKENAENRGFVNG